MRGRPRHYYVADREICKKCIYRSRMGSALMDCCGHIDKTGHSRIFRDGKRRVKKGYCDKFKESTMKQWTKEQLIDYIEMLEDNEQAVFDTIQQQAENFAKMLERIKNYQPPV